MGLMMLLSYKMSNGCDNEKRGGYGGFAAKAKNTNHLLKIAYISGICINMLAIIQAPSGGLPPSCRSHGV